MKKYLTMAVWLWAIQALTGGLLVTYVIVHTLDNAYILLSQKKFEDMLAFWHETLPHWFYILMVIGLVGVFLIHMLNGIRIASKPYKEIDKSYKHAWMLKHPGTYFWYTQVVTGSVIAIFGIWHLIVQHGTIATTTAAQSAARVTPTVYVIYLLFMAALMFHAFNGVRSVIIKLGIMTDKSREAILVGITMLLFVAFFFVGAASMGRFIPPPVTEAPTGVSSESLTPATGLESGNARPADEIPGLTSGEAPSGN